MRSQFVLARVWLACVVLALLGTSNAIEFKLKKHKIAHLQARRHAAWPPLDKRHPQPPPRPQPTRPPKAAYGPRRLGQRNVQNPNHSSDDGPGGSHVESVWVESPSPVPVPAPSPSPSGSVGNGPSVADSVLVSVYISESGGGNSPGVPSPSLNSPGPPPSPSPSPSPSLNNPAGSPSPSLKAVPSPSPSPSANGVPNPSPSPSPSPIPSPSPSPSPSPGFVQSPGEPGGPSPSNSLSSPSGGSPRPGPSASMSGASPSGSVVSPSNTKPVSYAPIQTLLPANMTRGHIYTVDVKLGPFNTTVPWLIDSGAFTTWTAAKECQNCVAGHMVTAVSAEGNGSCVKDESTYGTGGYSGCRVSVDLQMGPYRVPQFELTAATVVDNTFAAWGNVFSGIWGLGLNTAKGFPSVTDFLIQSGQLRDNWVGFALSRDPAKDSHLVFGDALKSKFAKPNTAVTLPNPNVAGAKYYATVQTMTAHGRAIELPFPGPVALLDTGTEDLYMPPDVVKAAFAAFRSEYQNATSSSRTLPCNLMNPTQVAMTLRFGGKEFGIQYQDLIEKPASNSTTECSVRLRASDQWILGETFLVNVYHAINVVDGTVMMADLA